MASHRFTQKYDWEPIDPLLIECYQEGRRAKLAELSEQTGIPGSTLSFRALHTLNLRKTHKKKQRTSWYSEEEDAILIANSMDSAFTISRKLCKAGFKLRNAHSIFNRMSTLRSEGKLLGVQDDIEDRDLLTTVKLAKEMGVDDCRVLRWIKLKYLKAQEQPRLPGSQSLRRYLIKRKDVREFLAYYQRHYDHALCRHGFLVETLYGDIPTTIQHSCGIKEA